MKQEAELRREDARHDRETYARLLAPNHMLFTHFHLHKRIEGFYENKDMPDFLGCDRLLKLDNIYGKVQLGYDPRKNKSFIFANIKTSILDTAPSRYQKELKEYRMFRSRKHGNENVLYSAKRKKDTSVLLYKAEPKPWTDESVLPYLRQVNQGALRKTMPFLSVEEEYNRIRENRKKEKELGLQVTQAIQKRDGRELAQVRSEQMMILREQELLQSILIRKNRQSNLFFRRLNYAFDIQKHEMFSYYRETKRKMRQEHEAPLDETPKKPQPNADEENHE